MSRPDPIALFLAATLLAGCSGNGLLTLKFNFKPGDKFSYTTTTKIEMEIQGNKKNPTSQIMGDTYAVQAGSGTSRDLRVTHDRIAIHTNLADKQIDFDSQKPDTYADDNPLAIMRRLVGKSFVITLSDLGQITAVKGLEEIRRGMADPNDPNAAVRGQVLSAMLNEDVIKSTISQSFAIYPDRPVKPGDTWARDVTLNMDGIKTTTKTMFKLSSVSNGIAHLVLDSKTDNSGYFPMSGTQAGTLDMDVATGMLLDCQLKQNLTGSPKDRPLAAIVTVRITGKKL